jgi:hypothetical protein
MQLICSGLLIKFVFGGVGLVKKTLCICCYIKQLSTLDNNKGFINLCFLETLKWMKTEWDQARFSSLV